MKPFDYCERLRLLRAAMDEEVARFIFQSSLTYHRIAELFGTNVWQIKRIAENAGIARGKGWRPKR
jgi:hypothetical protein